VAYIDCTGGAIRTVVAQQQRGILLEGPEERSGIIRDGKMTLEFRMFPDMGEQEFEEKEGQFFARRGSSFDWPSQPPSMEFISRVFGFSDSWWILHKEQAAPVQTAPEMEPKRPRIEGFVRRTSRYPPDPVRAPPQ